AAARRSREGQRTPPRRDPAPLRRTARSVTAVNADETPAISVRALTKDYGHLRAVNQVSFDVPRGSVFGFLGPNGAGKTTTIRMVLGLVHPTAGQIAILGREVTAPGDGVLAAVGAL